MLGDEGRNARIDLVPLLVRADGREGRRRDLDAEVQSAEAARVDQSALAAAANEEAAHGIERLLRRGESDPLNGPAVQRIEPLERERQMRATLVARHRVDLIDDDRAHAGEHGSSTLAREEQVER